MSADHVAVILIVDDEEAGRFIKGQVLRRAGFEVVEAATGAEGLERARDREIDLAVLDVNLPDIHGIEVCRLLKTEHGGPPAIQVLQISNTAITDADQVRGLQGGADVYLTEPIHPQVLVATAQSLLRIRRAERSLADALEREQRARAAAEEANRLKDQFLAALSHELRTPLNAIMGWVWQLQRDDLSDAARRKALDSLDRNTRAQARLINDLLDVSRISKGKIHLEMRLLDLRTVIESAAELVRAQVARKRLDLQIAAEPTGVMGDAARLEQAVSNLLANAIQFTPDGGRIVVSLSSQGGDAILRVADTGVGIVPALLPHVFDQFRQGEGSESRRHGGLGLGLTIVRQLVELHGGTVRVESAGLSQGSTFTVTLPHAAHTAQDLTAPSSEPLLTHVHALIVEDDPDARELLAAMLEASGAVTTTASSCEEALDLAADGSFDVLVSDIGLPDQDGLALLRQLRSRGLMMPAIAVSALTAERDTRRILDGGFQAHTPKPVQAADLVRAIASLVNNGGPAS